MKRRQDSFGRRARSEGFPARSVYKLEEIDRRTQLLRKGQRVLDLGASPGAWTMYAARQVGPTGHVLGIDIKEGETALPAHAEIRVFDANEIDMGELGKPFDVVMSDMAPNTTGHGDQFRSYELFMRALEIAVGVLKPGGTFVGKIFQGAEFEDARDEARKHFEKVRIIRPKATRTESYEVFIVGLNRQP